jgi:probable F420-dependent oxidoreductase
LKIGVSLPVRELRNDIPAIVAFAQLAEQLGFTHLRVPDQILRPNNRHLHEPLTLMAYLAALTKKIELTPSVIILPVRQTILVAKQAAEIDILSGGRLRLGIGVGGSEEEYHFMGENYKTRGKKCDEQMKLLKALWSKESVKFSGEWHNIPEAGINPLPIQRPIPMWIGARASPNQAVINRIGTLSDGWFVLCSPEEFPKINIKIHDAAQKVGRNPKEIGTEAGVAVVGAREHEWQSRVKGWKRMGLSHLCIRTLGGSLSSKQHLDKLQEISKELRDMNCY